jgi:hypothetical protein
MTLPLPNQFCITSVVLSAVVWEKEESHKSLTRYNLSAEDGKQQFGVYTSRTPFLLRVSLIIIIAKRLLTVSSTDDPLSNNLGHLFSLSQSCAC